MNKHTGGAKTTKASLVEKLHNENKITDEEYNKLTGQNGETEVDTITIGNITRDFSKLSSSSGPTIGEEYEDSWIGRKITYTSGNNDVSDWIILGKDKNGNVLITTKMSIDEIMPEIKCTLEQWCDYENTLNTACRDSVGTTGMLGTKSADIVEVRSITMEDINYVIGLTIPETFDTYTFGPTQNYANKQVNYYYPDEENKTWINPQTSGTTWTHKNDSYYYYTENGIVKYQSTNNINENNTNEIELTSTYLSRPNNMMYITGEGIIRYCVASRAVGVYEESASFDYFSVEGQLVGTYNHYLCVSDGSGGGDNTGNGGNFWTEIRPVVVLSGEIPMEDVELLNYIYYETF